VADLALGLRYLLDFALTVGAINREQRADLWQRGWDALGEAAAAQAAHIATAGPAGLFLRLLSAAVASGYAHIGDKDGNEPRDPQRWGWRPEASYVGEGTHTRHKPQGVRVGWLVDGELYLEPDASFAAVQRFARDQGESFSITANTLRRRLKERGLLASTDTARGKLTVRKTLQGSRRDVLHVGSNGTPPARTGPEGEAAEKPMADSWVGIDAAQDDAAHENTFVPATNGAMGLTGRSDNGEHAAPAKFHATQQATDWGDWQ